MKKYFYTVWRFLYVKYGNTKEFKTKGGIKVLDTVTQEASATRGSISERCFMIPFVPVTE